MPPFFVGFGLLGGFAKSWSSAPVPTPLAGWLIARIGDGHCGDSG